MSVRNETNYFSIDGFQPNITESDLESITPQIGSSINPTYENHPEFFTRTELNKIAIIGSTTITVIAGVFCTITALYISSIALAFFGALLTGGAVMGGAYYLLVTFDLDNPAERQQIKNWIADNPLSEIVKLFSDDDIIGYALLGNEASPNATTYAAFQILSQKLRIIPIREKHRISLINAEVELHTRCIQHNASPPNTGTNEIILLSRIRRIYEAYNDQTQTYDSAMRSFEAVRLSAILHTKRFSQIESARIQDLYNEYRQPISLT